MRMKSGLPGTRLSAALAWLLLSGCISAPDFREQDEHAQAGEHLQCVPYARLRSSVKLYGDAYTWWQKAAGRFARGPRPREGAVMVLTNYAGAERAHLAVVRKIVSPREVRIDHANWFDDGAIYVNDPVIDVSDENNWSSVRVWNIRTGAWGGRIYPVQGFIGPDGSDPSVPVASAGQDGAANPLADLDALSKGARPS
jgi:surface antigen